MGSEKQKDPGAKKLWFYDIISHETEIHNIIYEASAKYKANISSTLHKIQNNSSLVFVNFNFPKSSTFHIALRKGKL